MIRSLIIQKEQVKIINALFLTSRIGEQSDNESQS